MKYLSLLAPFWAACSCCVLVAAILDPSFIVAALILCLVTSAAYVGVDYYRLYPGRPLGLLSQPLFLAGCWAGSGAFVALKGLLLLGVFS